MTGTAARWTTWVVPVLGLMIGLGTGMYWMADGTPPPPPPPAPEPPRVAAPVNPLSKPTVVPPAPPAVAAPVALRIPQPGDPVKPVTPPAPQPIAVDSPTTTTLPPVPPVAPPGPAPVAPPGPGPVAPAGTAKDLSAGSEDPDPSLPVPTNPKFDLATVDGVLAGTASDAAGGPLASKWIRIDLWNGRWATDTLTTANGTFRVRGLPRGYYRARLMATGYSIAEFGPQLVRASGGARALVLQLAR